MDWTLLLANQQHHHHHHQQHQHYQQHQHQLSLRPPQFNDNNNNNINHISDNNMINNNNNNVILNNTTTANNINHNLNHSQGLNDNSYHYQCDLERQEQYLPPRGAPNGNNRNRNMTGGGRNSNSGGGNNTAIGSGNSQASNSRRRPKRIRTTFTPEQLNRLESEFSRQIYLVGEFREFLAKSLGLSEGQVKVWFQNRRIKHRKQFG